MRMIGYIQGSSVAHRLDPITKIIVLVSFCLLALLVQSLFIMLAALSTTIFLVWVSGSGRSFWRVRPIIFLCILLFFLQLLFNTTGRPLLAFDIQAFGSRVDILVTSGGLTAGARIASRLMIIVISSLFFVGTTDPSRMAYSLMRRGVPYRYGFMLILALRFIPIFQIEAGTVRKAQVARGLKIDTPGPRTLIRLARYTFMPLLVSSLARVGTISISMEGRAFGLHRSRTFLRSSVFCWCDWVVSLVSLALLIGTVVFVG